MAILESRIILSEVKNDSCIYVRHFVEKKEYFPGIKALVKTLEIYFSPTPETAQTYILEFEDRENDSRYYLGETNEGSKLYININPKIKKIKLYTQSNTELEPVIYFELFEKKSEKILFFPFIIKTNKSFLAEESIHKILSEPPSLAWMENASEIEKIIKKRRLIQ